MRRAITLVVGTLLSGVGFAAHAQIQPSQAIQAPNAARQAASPAAQAEKPTAQAAKPTTRAGVKPPAPKRAAKGGAAVAKAPSSPNPAAAEAGPAASEVRVARRDPFESLLGKEKGPPPNLPPGKAGLQVASLRLDGIVRAPNGMIAVVTNPQARTYFLREGDKLYDGSVEKIAMDSVSFHEIGKDAFGKPVERQVNKRIYSSAGEQQ